MTKKPPRNRAGHSPEYLAKQEEFIKKQKAMAKRSEQNPDMHLKIAYGEMVWKEEDYPKVKETIEEYFNEQKSNNQPPTVTGLILALGISKKTFYNWRNNEGKFDKPKNIIELLEQATLYCEDWIAVNMLTGKANAVSSIFTLKNNFGWKDKTETDITSNGNSLMSQPITIKMPKSVVEGGVIEGQVSPTFESELKKQLEGIKETQSEDVDEEQEDE